MAFGAEPPKRISDPICEPLWAGERVLVEVAGPDVGIRNVDGDSLIGFEALRAAIVASASAGELVLDGYLLPAPLRDTIGAEAPLGMETTPTPKQVGRQMLIGGGNSERRDEREREEERRVTLIPDAPAAFVSVDLLWLEGEPLLDVPLLERKRLLDSVVADHALVRRTVIVRPPVEAWYGQWRALGFREFAVKSANSRYHPGTASPSWTTAPIPRR
jgi:hypothetical protein